jgi:hypothetical protein
VVDGVPTPDDDLVAELNRARGYRRVEIAVALGDSEGETGPAQLRGLLQETGPGTSDLRCAALLALAKRCQDGAHDDFALAYRSTDPSLRGYAVLALSAYGRDGLWEEVADRLVTTVKRERRRSTTPSEVIVMIVYLARHAAAREERLPALITGLREHWEALDPDDGGEAKHWVATYWPDAAPGGPPPDEVFAPYTTDMEIWIRQNPLFGRAS